MTAPPIGAGALALYAAAAAAIEFAAALAGPLVAVAGYAALLLVLANHVAVVVSRSSIDRKQEAAAGGLIAVPVLLRFVALTLESHGVPVARHYALVGLSAVAALLCVTVAFPELRPRIGVPSLSPILAALPIGAFISFVYGRASLVPRIGRWSGGLSLLVVVLGAAVVEELLFRGFVQRMLHHVVGKAAPIVGAAAVGLVYLGVHPAGLVCVFVAIGLVSALFVEAFDDIAGVTFGRILVYAGLFFVWPRLLR